MYMRTYNDLKPYAIPFFGLVILTVAAVASKSFTTITSFDTRTKAAVNSASGITKYSTLAVKDPFYPDYPGRRFLFPTSNLSWWGSPGLTKYTITSIDPRVRMKTVSFYAAGYARCTNGVEMGLPFGNALGSTYNHNTCSLTASDDFNFLFPSQVTTTQVTTLDSAARLAADSGGLSETIYLPLSWWSN